MAATSGTRGFFRLVLINSRSSPRCFLPWEANPCPLCERGTGLCEIDSSRPAGVSAMDSTQGMVLAEQGPKAGARAVCESPRPWLSIFMYRASWCGSVEHLSLPSHALTIFSCSVGFASQFSPFAACLLLCKSLMLSLRAVTPHQSCCAAWVCVSVFSRPFKTPACLCSLAALSLLRSTMVYERRGDGCGVNG